MKCGELRWSDRENRSEVLIPSIAFRNSGSSFLGQKPFCLILPDLLDLYKYLEAYIDRHRGVLLGAKDPGTFFAKTVKTTSLDAAYDATKFYEAWRTGSNPIGSTIPTPAAAPSRACCRTDLIIFGIFWQHISSSRPDRMSRRVMPSKTHRMSFSSTMADSSRRTRQRLRQGSSIRFGKPHSRSDHS